MSFFKGRTRRPKGARSLEERDSLGGDMAASSGFGGFYESSASSASASSSRAGPSASMHVAGIMSEQQSIITGLRSLSGPPESVMESPEFLDLVSRIQAVQQQANALVKGNSVEGVRAEDQKVLVRQTKSIMDLLTKLTGPQQEPQPHARATSGSFNVAAGAAAADFGGGRDPTPRWSTANPPPPPPLSPDAPPPQAPLIDFS